MVTSIERRIGKARATYSMSGLEKHADDGRHGGEMRLALGNTAMAVHGKQPMINLARGH